MSTSSGYHLIIIRNDDKSLSRCTNKVTLIGLLLLILFEWRICCCTTTARAHWQLPPQHNRRMATPDLPSTGSPCPCSHLCPSGSRSFLPDQLLVPSPGVRRIQREDVHTPSPMNTRGSSGQKRNGAGEVAADDPRAERAQTAHRQKKEAADAHRIARVPCDEFLFFWFSCRGSEKKHGLSSCKKKVPPNSELWISIRTVLNSGA